KCSFLNSTSCPDFSDLEVCNFLSERAINLNTVFVAMHLNSINKVETHSVSKRVSI
ncbi:hypothetical protein ARMSODRAFT_899055, partial [Armillaria solidipes]